MGYGDGGAPPWQFGFAPGVKKDIGFFKLFLCSRATDFSSIVQYSPFEIAMWRRGRLAVSDNNDIELWATKLATVIQIDL